MFAERSRRKVLTQILKSQELYDKKINADEARKQREENCMKRATEHKLDLDKKAKLGEEIKHTKAKV